MIKNYFKIALRNIGRHKIYSSINVLGLAFGIACFLLIALYAIDELTFDGFHERPDDIYRVVEHRTSSERGDEYFGLVAHNVAEAAKTEIPTVEESVKMLMWGKAIIRNPENRNEFYHPFITVEPSVFEIFNFPLLHGDENTALNEPNAVVLSQDLSQKLFGSVDPLGRTVRSDRGMDLKVTGVLSEIPRNSHLQFDVMVSHATLEAQPFYDNRMKEDWSSQNWTTYLLLKSHADPSAIGQQLTAMAKSRAQDERPSQGSLQLQPLDDIHFGSTDYQRGMNAYKGSYSHLYIFTLIGFFILGIACINYINLSTARAATYSKEVGIRKTVGAGRSQLFGRFMSESILITLIASVIAVGLVSAALPYYNVFVDKALSLVPSDSYWPLILLLGVVVFVSLAAVSYPSLYLARFRPQVALKGNFNIGMSGQGRFRKALVVLQFALSITMIIGTIVAWQQMNYVQNKDLGFNEDHLLVVDINSGAVRNGYNTIANRYRELPGVQSVSVSSRVPGEWKNILQADVRPPGSFEEVGLRPYFIGADESFLETFDIALQSGRNFDVGRPADTANVIINSTAAKAFGIAEAAGQEVLIMSRLNNGSERVLSQPWRAKVIGVTADYNFQSLYEPIVPLVLGFRNNPIQSIDYFTARISGENVERTIAQMTDILLSVDPNQLFEYHFLDDQLETFYRADVRRSLLFTIAAICAIVIACLGLFGLAVFAAERRTKEIGIRKVLGASVTGIVGLLAKDFLKLVVIALLIAAPISSYFLYDWLQDFAYHIEIRWWVYVAAGLIAVVITFLTISLQGFKSARANPIESLRTE